MSEITLKQPDFPAPPKTDRLKLVLIGLAVFAAVAAVTIAAGYYVDSLAVDRHFEAGYANYDKAFNELEEALPALSKVRIGGSDPKYFKVELTKTMKRIPRAQKRLESARREFDMMQAAAFSGDERKVASLSRLSVTQAEKGAAELAAKIEQLGVSAEILTLTRGAADKFGAGFAKNNNAISAGNEDKFEDGARDADEAAKLFAQARSLLAQAAEMAEEPAVADAGAKIGRAQRWAGSTKKMMAAGMAEQLDVYNRLARDNNRLSDEVTRMARDPLLSDPDGWMRDILDERNDSIQAAFRRADHYRDQAIKRWEQNT